MKNKIIKDVEPADYAVVHFNGANRTFDRETTDATAIHPISKKCETLLNKISHDEDIISVNGVVLLSGLGTDVINKLSDFGMIEHTVFTDEAIG